MSTETDNTTEIAPVEDSHLARLKARRKKLQGARTKDIAVPGYGGELVARFGTVDWEDVNRLQRRVSNDEAERAVVDGQADLLIRACQAILVRETGGPVPIDQDTPVPVKFDKRLAELLELDLDPEHPARSVLYGVFSAAPSAELAVDRVYTEYALWLNGSEEEVSEEFVGE